MELSSLTLRVLLLFFPGLLCAMVVDALTAHRERTPVQFLTHAFVLGLGSYVSLSGLRALYVPVARRLSWPTPPAISFFAVLLDEKKSILWGEIALSGVIAVLLGAVVSAVVSHKLLHRAARRIGVSRKFGDLDVWSLVFNSPETNWVVARDLTYDLTYYGWVEAFSDTYDKAELLLRDVDVYRSSSGTKLYQTDRVYFARPSESLVIEPVLQQGSGNARGAPDEQKTVDPGGDVLTRGQEPSRNDAPPGDRGVATGSSQPEPQQDIQLQSVNNGE